MGSQEPTEPTLITPLIVVCHLLLILHLATFALYFHIGHLAIGHSAIGHLRIRHLAIGILAMGHLEIGILAIRHL